MLKKWYQQHTLIIITIILVAVAGMVFIYPFHQSHFRFTLGVAALSSLLLYFPRLPVVTTAVLSGLAIFLMRSMIYLPYGLTEFYIAASHNLPAVAYYLVYGVCFWLFNIRAHIRQVLSLVLLLGLVDILSNCAELLIRSKAAMPDMELLLVTVVAIGLVRPVIAIAGYYALRQYRDLALAEDRLARYAELTVLTAQLKTELYYLQKSSQDIERIMEQSYLLYQDLREVDIIRQPAGYASRALNVAWEMHEVKKDYYRVITGIEKVLQTSANEHSLHLSEIFFIIERNALQISNVLGKQLTIDVHYQNDFLTDQHYVIVSILNNLVMNAIEACSDGGFIKIEQVEKDGIVSFFIADNGTGIKKNEYALIFRPGYSTKFCPYTGKISTGLGLSHAKDLVEYLQGTIELLPLDGDGTIVAVHLPEHNMIYSDKTAMY